MSCKLFIFDVLGSSSSLDKDEDDLTCDVVDIIVLIGVEIIIDFISFSSS
jgi:hypothetical protein